jgi:hypothetical protein
MGKSHDDEMDQAKRIMSALVRMPPKPHDEMKLGKRAATDLPEGTQAVLTFDGSRFISGYHLLPDGKRIELPPEALGSRKLRS